MTPIKQFSVGLSGHKQITMTLDPLGIILNSIAMGDMIAAAPVVKYLLDHFFITPESYTVVAKKHFRPFFPFVRDENFRDFDSSDPPLWGIQHGTAMALFNTKADGMFVRNTPKAMHLSHYASIKLADRIIPLEKLPYVPLDKVPVDRFGVDFSKAVVLVTSYRDVTRMWYTDEILRLAKWIKSIGLIPVFIGKTDMDADVVRENLIPKSSLPNDVSEYGVDLRNQTSIPELASIMSMARAVCGVDSGPIHLAGTTATPIICGYPTVAAEHRIPTRKKGKTIALTPRLECANCESRWKSSLWNYEHCPLGHADCCKDFTAERYIDALKKVLTK